MSLPVYLEKKKYCGSIPDNEQLEKFLYIASRHIDSLTFNRIIGKGYDNLTEFQKEILDEVCGSLADFEYENQDILQSVLTSYGINGVSASFNSENQNIVVQNGVAIKRDLYDLLKQTGLCCRRLGA